MFPRLRSPTGSYQIGDRNLNVEKATKMMISMFKWRDEFKIDELATEGFTQDVFGLASHIFGKDKDGRPVM